MKRKAPRRIGITNARIFAAPKGAKVLRKGDSLVLPNGDVIVNDGPDPVSVIGRQARAMGSRGARIRINPGT